MKPGNKKSKNLFSFLLSPFFFLLFFFFAFFHCNAQTEKIPLPKSLQQNIKTEKKRPVFTVGSGIGAQFGATSAVEISPFAGIYATKWLVFLVNGEYAFMWNKNYFNAHIWGIGVAVQPCIIDRILLHAGYKFNQIQIKWLDIYPREKENFNYVVLGGGYKQYLAQKIYIQGLVLIDIPINPPTINNYSHSFYPYFKVSVGIDL
ncbi:MAG: hypothetical protein LBI45_07415 [Bacteroidales bacterium]|jgi:hypothetical protein|nr:hypothetical protein [Bacteroidales bacterium]